MERKDILLSLIQDADSLYATEAYASDPDFRSRVAAAEEELLTALLSLNQDTKDTQKKEGPSLSQIIHQVERLRKGKALNTDDPALRSESMRNYMDIRLMEADTPAKQVPEALMAYVERSLDFEEAQVEALKTPGFAVSLIQDGLSIVKSSLQGFLLEPGLAPAVRKNAPRPSRSVLQYQSKLGPIQIELLNEGNHRLSVNLSFPRSLSGQAILKYVEGSDLTKARILDSYSLNHARQLSFHSLEKGAYVIEIPTLDCRMPFLVDS